MNIVRTEEDHTIILTLEEGSAQIPINSFYEVLAQKTLPMISSETKDNIRLIFTGPKSKKILSIDTRPSIDWQSLVNHIENTDYSTSDQERAERHYELMDLIKNLK